MTKYKWVFIALPLLAGLSLRQNIIDLSPQSAKLLYGSTSSSSTLAASSPSRNDTNVTHSEELVTRMTPPIPFAPIAPINNITDPTTNIKAPSSSNLLLFWVGGVPASANDNDLFVYYKSMAHAIDNNPNIDSCRDQLLERCYYFDAFNQNVTNTTSGGGQASIALPQTPLYVVFPHALTTAPGKLYRYIKIISKKLASLKEKQQEQFSGMHRPVYALLMVNKVYSKLDVKLSPFLDAFGDDYVENSDSSTHNRNTIVDGALIMTWSPHAKEWSQQYGMSFEFIPFGVDFSSFSVSSDDKNRAAAALPTPYKDRECDVFVNWDNNPDKYSFRVELDEVLWKHANETASDSHLFYNSTTGLTVYHPNHFLSEREYIHAMNNCKMVVSTIGMPGRYDLVGTRYYEVLSLGTSLLIVERAYNDDDNGVNKDRHQNLQSQKLKSNLAYSGVLRELIKENETVAMFSSIEEFIERAIYYKTHVDEAQRMIDLGKELVQNHSWDHRAKHLVTSLQKYHVSRVVSF